MLVSIPPSTLCKCQTVLKENLTHRHDSSLDLQSKLIDTVHKDSAKSHTDEDSYESQSEGELKYKHIQYKG